MGATLDGHATCFGQARNLVLRFFTHPAGAEQFRAASIADATGNFTIYDIPPGTWDVGIKADGSITRWKESQVFTEGQTTEIDFGILVSGDLDGDDYVGGSDYSALLASYGSYGEAFIAGIRDSDWLLPECPSPPPPGGACYGYVIS